MQEVCRQSPELLSQTSFPVSGLQNCVRVPAQLKERERAASFRCYNIFLNAHHPIRFSRLNRLDMEARHPRQHCNPRGLWVAPSRHSGHHIPQSLGLQCRRRHLSSASNLYLPPISTTVEPLNKGHYGTNDFVLCREVVPISEVK